MNRVPNLRLAGQQTPWLYLLRLSSSKYHSFASVGQTKLLAHFQRSHINPFFFVFVEDFLIQRQTLISSLFLIIRYNVEILQLYFTQMSFFFTFSSQSFIYSIFVLKKVMLSFFWHGFTSTCKCKLNNATAEENKQKHPFVWSIVLIYTRNSHTYTLFFFKPRESYKENERIIERLRAF